MTTDKRSLDGLPCRLHLSSPPQAHSTRTQRRSRTPLPRAATRPALLRHGRHQRGGRAGGEQVRQDLRLLRQQPRQPPGLRGRRARPRERAGNAPPVATAAGPEFRSLARLLRLLPFALTLAAAGLRPRALSLRRWRGGSIWSTAAAASGSWA